MLKARVIISREGIPCEACLTIDDMRSYVKLLMHILPIRISLYAGSHVSIGFNLTYRDCYIPGFRPFYVHMPKGYKVKVVKGDHTTLLCFGIGLSEGKPWQGGWLKWESGFISREEPSRRLPIYRFRVWPYIPKPLGDRSWNLKVIEKGKRLRLVLLPPPRMISC